MCQCKSYNRPDWGGDKEEVILYPPPEWGYKNGICVDSCIAGAILMLWGNRILTRGCCCGHNRENPTVILDESLSENDCVKVANLLKENDGRNWTMMQWRLVKI